MPQNDDNQREPFRGAKLSNGPHAGPLKTLRKMWHRRKSD
jgi:hypothetical protein